MTNEKRNKSERRKDAPSGRQAATHPEHDTGKIDQTPSSLHQGQGPDFQTQDSHLQQRNPAVRNLRKDATNPANEPDRSNAREPRSRQSEPDQNSEQIKRDTNNLHKKKH